ncbi:hypothetical protein A3D88_01155 [Candidatus Peribacteria bacterium RIFCSPHIGHO2_02_FULL_52_16]|nr:MAG: hypothetical protein A2706_05800 [Candidatus Peribacteria bacterium RIFCSPHIGHO2_01_FULL_51_35]OGJ61271.1 MAG: hypothetical protein A3D88_01155 [Candidatus Peribacteria bacterium RIFCSPHIGHO2_02_FULL_52_16]
MKSLDFSHDDPVNQLPAVPSPEGTPEKRLIPLEDNPITRRTAMKYGIAALFVGGAAAGIPWKETEAKDADPKHVLELKHQALKENRGIIRHLRDLKKGSPKEVLGQGMTTELFRKLQLLMGCIDERLTHKGLHKIGIAGLGAGMSKEEMNLLKLFFREHPEIAKRIMEVCWHEHCAARESDDAAAEAGGKELVDQLGMPLSKLKRAGFSDAANVSMSGDLHVHPGQMLVIDGTEEYTCNGEVLGAPAYGIAATGVPLEYVKNEVALIGTVMGGKSGMGEVLGPDDPILAFIASDTSDGAKELEVKLKPAFAKFPKEPEFIHLVRS